MYPSTYLQGVFSSDVLEHTLHCDWKQSHRVTIHRAGLEFTYGVVRQWIIHPRFWRASVKRVHLSAAKGNEPSVPNPKSGAASLLASKLIGTTWRLRDIEIL